MPGFNRLGPPNGAGNRTGRRLGKCNDTNRDKQDENNETLRGQGHGFGCGETSNNHQGRLGLGNGQQDGQRFGKGQGRGQGRRNK